MNNSNEECIICGGPLEYLDKPIEMECAICHHKFTNNVRCEQGHYVCDECHTSGIDTIIGICMQETSKNPIEVIERALARIAETGGPRCCKRDSYNAILAAIEFVEDKFGIKTTSPTHLLSQFNEQPMSEE